MADGNDPNGERKRWMAVLARASKAEIEAALGGVALPAYTHLRSPETGLVMVRGRAGGGGEAFNVGEATATRCAVRSANGYVGHSYVLGRDHAQAELAAVIDAALQDPAYHSRLQFVIAPLAAQQRAARQARTAKAAATRVQFFTMATMR